MVLPVAAYSLTMATFMGHEAAHAAACRTSRQNWLLYSLSFPLMVGVSMRWWSHKHNRVHHRFPNVVGKDIDLQMYPMAIGAHYHEISNPLLRQFQKRMQGWGLWPLSSLLSVGMRTKSIVFLLREVRQGVCLAQSCGTRR